MELVKDMRELFSDDKSWSKWFLLHYAKREGMDKYADSIIKGNPVELEITLNGITITKVDMDEAMKEITDLHLESLGATEEKLKKDRENFNNLVTQKAEELINEKMENLEELFYETKNNLSMINSLATKNISWKN